MEKARKKSFIVHLLMFFWILIILPGRISIASELSSNIPSGVKAIFTNNNTIEVNWSPVENAVGYEVYRSTYSDEGYIRVNATRGIFYRDLSLATGTTYYYIVRSFSLVENERIYSEFSEPVSAKVLLSTVNNLSTSASDNQIALGWSPVEGAYAYEIYHSINRDGVFTRITATRGTSYVHSNLGLGEIHYYRIRAYMLIGTTKLYSNFVDINCYTVPQAPKNIIANPSSNIINLSWNTVPGAYAYEVYHSNQKDGFYERLTATRTNRFSHSGLVLGSSHYYKIRAYVLLGTKKIYGSFEKVECRTIPASPASFTAIAQSDKVNLTWNSVPGVYAYEIFRINIGTGTSERITATRGTTFTDIGLSNGDYIYRLRSYVVLEGVKVFSNLSETDGLEIITFKNELDIENYLTKHFTNLTTVIGDTSFTFTAIQNTSVYSPEDYQVWTRFDSSFFNRFDSIEYTDSEKQLAREQIKDHQKKIADSLMQIAPDKKFQGCYFHSWYRYPTLKVDLIILRYYSWQNYDYVGYNSTAYYDALPSYFRWTPLYDDVL